MVCINIHIDPFMDTRQNLLSLFCLIQLAATMFVGLLLKVGSLHGETSSTVMGLLTFLNAIVVIVPMVEVFLMVRDNVAGRSTPIV